MSRSTEELRELWRAYGCAPEKMVVVPFGPDRIKVAPPTADAWKALARVLRAFNYLIRIEDTDSYNCRKITGGTELSLHSYGIALDVNWKTNPYRDHQGVRSVRFSDKPTQDERSKDVKHDLADTDMLPEMVEAVRRISTMSGKRVFEWGGDWRTVKDCMHFEIDLSPEELNDGIDWNTVPEEAPVPTPAEPAARVFTHRVIARDGLRLRAGPGTEFEKKTTWPFNTLVAVLNVSGDWSLVDIEGDGKADGYMHSDFLQKLR